MPIENSGGGFMITGNAVNWYAVLVVKQAAKLYLETGMQANRAYTPTNIRRFAEGYTGKHYNRSRKGLEAAYADLVELLASREPDTMVPLDKTSAPN